MGFKNHKTLKNRVKRANEFVTKFNKFKNVYVDGWSNNFEQIFQAWSDKFVLVDKEFKILNK
jgi:hypothetical protein